MDLISIIVPIYNVESYLERCVESIRRQTYKNLEIILVDDGSPDHCGQMCDDYAADDSRIKVVHKINGGLGYARNSGLEVATGEYVTFVDADDWIKEDHIEKLYQAAEEKRADMVLGGFTTVDSNGAKQEKGVYLVGKTLLGESIVEEILLNMIAPEPMYDNDVLIQSSVCTNLYRRSVIQKHTLSFISERESVAEDLHFNVDFLYHSNCVTAVKETGYYYFANQQSITREYDPLRSQRTVNFYYSMKQKVEKYGIADQAIIHIDRCFLVKIRVAIRLIVLSNMTIQEKLWQIKMLLQEEVTIEILQRYPINRYIPAMRLLAYLMKMQNALAVYSLMMFRESIGRRGLVKKILKVAGIGR